MLLNSQFSDVYAPDRPAIISYILLGLFNDFIVENFLGLFKYLFRVCVEVLFVDAFIFSADNLCCANCSLQYEHIACSFVD